ncbi:MAG: iron ABC transporter permease [Clostridiales bacterium]|nr:iron ABC transporter permease [Clostridiales bacterium]
MKRENFSLANYIFFCAATIAVFLVCLCVGSVGISPANVFQSVLSFLTGGDIGTAPAGKIIVFVRLPRVICAALTGATLSVCGAAMQGLLKNPLADGSTLGVSSGAALGAVLAIALGGAMPFFANAGIVPTAIIFAFVSLFAIIALANKLDSGLAANTIILTGVVFSMFANSLISLIISFSGEKIKPIIFWTMGSLADANYSNALLLLIAFLTASAVIIKNAAELNACAIGEENARHVGVNVKRVKLLILIASSAAIGICVSVSGTIGFVGLIVPHITRLLTGPNHKRLLPASAFFGAYFLMLADLLARFALSPRELPVGVITSLIGALMFLSVFYRASRNK